MQYRFATRKRFAAGFALAAVTVVIGVLGVPSVGVAAAAVVGPAMVPSAAAASASPRVVPEQVPGTPPVCDKVSATAVSGVLGYPVTLFFGMAKSGTSVAQGATASATICSFIAGTAQADLPKAVILFFMTVCKSPMPATGKCVPKKVTFGEVKQVIDATDAADHYSVTAIKKYSGLGVPGMYVSGTGTVSETGAKLTFEEVAGFGGKAGNKVASALVAQADPKSEVAALADLAVKAYL
jgi:hypothetical protein